MNIRAICYLLLVLSVNIFSRHNLLHSLPLVLSLLWRNKYSAKKCLKNHVSLDFLDDLTLAHQKTGKTIERPSKELPWNQQVGTLENSKFAYEGLRVNRCDSYNLSSKQRL